MSIRHLLSSPVSALPTTASCVEAARRMRREKVGSVVVQENDTPVGIITDRDLAVRVLAEERNPAKTTVGSVMSKFPAFVKAHRSLPEALAVMREMSVRRLPAVDESGRVIGLLSLDDALISLAGQFAQIEGVLRAETDRSDETLPE